MLNKLSPRQQATWDETPACKVQRTDIIEKPMKGMTGIMPCCLPIKHTISQEISFPIGRGHKGAVYGGKEENITDFYLQCN